MKSKPLLRPSGAASLEYGIKAVWSTNGQRLYWMTFCGYPGRDLWRFV